MVLTADELNALLAQVNPATVVGLRNKAMLKVMAYGGLRVSEIAALRTKDVRHEGKRTVLDVRAGKGNRDRTVPLADHVAETLGAWMAKRRDLGIPNGAVFCTVSEGRDVHPVATADGLSADQVTESALVPGKPVSPRYVQALVPRLAERAGIEKRVTPHVLRHTAATMTLRAHGDVRRVQTLLGHSSVQTTQVYTHVDEADVAEAVDLVPDVEKREAPEAPADAADLAARIAAMTPDQRAALVALLGEVR